MAVPLVLPGDGSLIHWQGMRAVISFLRSHPVWFYAGALVVATWLAYANSLEVPFMFDDVPTLKAMAGGDLTGSGGVTVASRPVARWTLSCNRALSGEAVWSYHVVNVMIHSVAGLLMLGVVRRTLLRVDGGRRFSVREAAALAAVVTGVWLLHPLQTESVTYVVQRTEALVSVCALLTLYAFVRSVDGEPGAGYWRWIAVGACWLGMGTKEVMIGVPLLVVLYDRTFVAASWREVWRERRGYHLAMAAGWLWLAWLVAGNPTRGGTAGLGAIVNVHDYALTQCAAVVRYLRLVFWPHPLVFDYGVGLHRTLVAVWPQALLLGGLVALTGWWCWRRPALGFLGVVFFVLLAPSSSVVPIATQTVAEHRVYLASLVPILGVVLAGHAVWGARSLWVWLPVMALLGLATQRRNLDYATPQRLWEDTLAKWPENPRAYYNVAVSLMELRQWAQCEELSRQAILLAGTYPDALTMRGLALEKLGRSAEARSCYTEAVRLKADHFSARNNLGRMLAEAGDYTGAEQHLLAALAAAPANADARANLGEVWRRQGRLAEAEKAYRAALALNARLPDLRDKLGNTLLLLWRPAEAVEQYRAALAENPRRSLTHYNWGNACLQTGDWHAAAQHYAEAVRLQPDFPDAEFNWGNACAQGGLAAEAIGHYQRVVKLAPTYVDAWINLGTTQAQTEDYRHAAESFRHAATVNPREPVAFRNLGLALARVGDLAGAVEAYTALLQLTPDDAEVRAALALWRRQLAADKKAAGRGERR